MTGSEIKTFCETALEMDNINDVAFYQLLNVAKTKLEEERNWKILEKDDTSQTASTSDTFLSFKTLPTDFGNDMGLFVVNGNNQPIWYDPIPFLKRYEYKDASRRYYIDLANSRYALTGKLSSGYTTIHLVYRSASTDIAEGTSWVFPSRFHAILGFLVAEMYKGGADYDEISARQIIQNRADAALLYQSLLDWDTNLRVREQNGMYTQQGGYDSDGIPEGTTYDFPIGLM